MRKRIYLCVLAGVLTLETGAVTVQAAELDLPVAAEKNITELAEGEDTTVGEREDMDTAADHANNMADNTLDRADNVNDTDDVNDAENGSIGDDTVDPADQGLISSEDTDEKNAQKDSVAEDQEEKTTDNEAEETFEEEISEMDTYDASVSPVEAFVIRFYTKALQREQDAEGVQYWTNALKNGSKNGAGIADAFIFGEEFKAKKVSNSTFIDILYQVFMDRSADAAGKSYWMSLLEQGTSRRNICSKFIKSAEFSKICENYGIQRGELTLSAADQAGSTGKVSEKQLQFVRQIYEKIFGRTADEEGLYYYASQLGSKKMTGAELLDTFLNSKEFLQEKLSDEEYIEVLYQACLGRQADKSGLQYWLSVKNQGVSNTYIAAKFSESQEFSVLCQNAGVEKGKITLKEARDKNLNMTGYVYRCYEKTLNRLPDTEGLNYWCKGLLDGKYNAEKVAMNFVFSKEVENKKLSYTEFVKMLYRVFMGREADASGLEYWTGRIKAGRNRKAVFYGFSRSKEFSQILTSFGLTISSERMDGAVFEDGVVIPDDDIDAEVKGTYLIMGSSSVTVQQMVNYFKYVMPTYPSYYQGTEIETIEQFCQVYYEEAKAEGVKVEVAFCQAMLETGFLKYGGDVDISQYNFAGLGATGNGVHGNGFSSPREGIRAQIQHLKAYASKAPLNQECVDVRFSKVKRGTAIYLEWLGIQENPYGGGWATAKNYGVRIKKMIDKLKTF